MTAADAWAGLVLFSVAMYVVLDGYDLGVGVLTLFSRSDADRKFMTQTVATAWDGNESWLVLLGVALYGGLPLAYSIALPALYVPLLLMLFSLVLRGASIEFQAQSTGYDRRWGQIFGLGSLGAAFCQGTALGGLISGITVRDERFAGGPFDFIAHGYGPLCGLAAVALYTLAGAAWIYDKSDGALREHAGRWGRRAVAATGLAAATCWALVSAASDARLTLDEPQRIVLVIVGALATLGGLGVAWQGFARRPDWRPFLGVIAVYAGGLLAVVALQYPQVVPPGITVAQAASSTRSLNFLLIGVGVCIPMILTYNGYAYYIFRGKAQPADRSMR